MVHIDVILSEYARRAYDGVVFTRFLDPLAAASAFRVAKSEGIGISVNGGYEGAERVVAAFYTSREIEDWPIAALSVKWDSRYCEVSHRDILGAVMGLGVTREMTGDIVVGNGSAVLMVIEAQADYISANLLSAGKAKVSTSRHFGAIVSCDEGLSDRIVVSSPRLDAVLAGVFKISRAEAVSLVEAEMVRRNYLVCVKSSVVLAEGDVVSVRGYGRVKVDFIGETRKGRVALEVKVFR